MKILFIVNDLAYFRAHREQLALNLIERGHELVIASGGCDHIDRSNWHPDMKLHALDLDKHHFRPREDLSLIADLIQLYRDEQPDIVHCFTIKPVLYGGIALPVAKTLGAKPAVVWTFPGLGKIFEPTKSAAKVVRRAIVRRVLQALSSLFPIQSTFENEADLKDMVSMGVAKGDRAHGIMGTGLDLSHFSPSAEPKDMDDPSPLTFFMATRLIGEKGVDTLLSACQRLQKEGHTFRCLLAGLLDTSNPDAIPLEQIHRAERDGLITFMGPLTQKQMPDAFRECDVFCMPTRLREGFPRSLLEAASCGTAIIASDQRPMRVLVNKNTDGENIDESATGVSEGPTGWLINPPNVNNLTAAMRQALNAPAEARSKGERARLLVESLPVGGPEVTDGFERVYQKAVEGR